MHERRRRGSLPSPAPEAGESALRREPAHAAGRLTLWQLLVRSSAYCSPPARPRPAASEATIYPRRTLLILAISAAATLVTVPAPTQTATQVPSLPFVASGGADNSIRLWDSAGKQAQNILAHDSPVAALALSPDGRRLFSCSADRTVKVWNTDDATMENSFDAHEKAVTCLALSPDGRILVTGGADNAVKLWNSQTGKIVRSLNAHSQPVRAVAWSPDGTRFASSGMDRLIQIWRADGNLAGTIVTQDDPVTALAWTRDGQSVVGGSADGYLKVWSANDLGVTVRHRAHERAITALDVQKAGTGLIATAGADLKLKLWTLGPRSVTETATTTLDRAASCLSWSRSGTIIVTGGSDRALRYWTVSPLAEAKRVPSAHDSAVTAVVAGQ